MLERLLIISAILFAIGLYGVLSRKHIISILMSAEIMFNAANLALVAFSRYTIPASYRFPSTSASPEHLLLSCQTFAVFVIVIAAAEVALGLALIIAIARRNETSDITNLSIMRG